MSTNYMNKAALTKLTKSQLVELLLKMNSEIEKIQNQIVKKQPEPIKPTPAPRKSVKQMVQDYEDNIIDHQYLNQELKDLFLLLEQF